MAKSSMGMKVGKGVAVVSALALGAYLLYGKNGAKNRKAVKGWMLKAKGEILEQLENVKDMSVDKYHELVDSIVAKYSAKTGMSKADIAALVKELKSYGKHALGTAKKSVKKITKKPAVKKAVKKAKKAKR